MEQTFSFDINTGSQQEVVHLSGTIDADAEKHFEVLEKQLQSNEIIFNFREVGRVNSMGVALILRCLKRLTSDKKITVQLQGLSQMHTMLFKMSGVFLLAKEVG